MSFGKNPHVAKAKAAEQKAADATDNNARSNAWREAARQWERAAERETFDKRVVEYNQNAETARASADAVDDPPSAARAAASTSTTLN